MDNDFCTRCGVALRPGWEFCGKCGTPRETHDPYTSTHLVPPPPPTYAPLQSGGYQADTYARQYNAGSLLPSDASIERTDSGTSRTSSATDEKGQQHLAPRRRIQGTILIVSILALITNTFVAIWIQQRLPYLSADDQLAVWIAQGIPFLVDLLLVGLAIYNHRLFKQGK